MNLEEALEMGSIQANDVPGMLLRSDNKPGKSLRAYRIVDDTVFLYVEGDEDGTSLRYPTHKLTVPGGGSRGLIINDHEELLEFMEGAGDGTVLTAPPGREVWKVPFEHLVKNQGRWALWLTKMDGGSTCLSPDESEGTLTGTATMFLDKEGNACLSLDNERELSPAVIYLEDEVWEVLPYLAPLVVERVGGRETGATSTYISVDDEVALARALFSSSPGDEILASYEGLRFGRPKSGVDTFCRTDRRWASKRNGHEHDSDDLMESIVVAVLAKG